MSAVVDKAHPRVLIIEDHEVADDIAESLEHAPEAFVCVVCRGVAAALKAIEVGKFDVALVDLSLPDGRGTVALRHLRRVQPTCVPLVLTVASDDKSIFDALRSGAQGYLLKTSTPAQLLAGIREARAGGAPLHASIARRIVASFSEQSAPMASLTSREEEVLKLLAKGHSYADIGAGLGIALSTVQSYIKNIYQKLEVSTKAEAATIAERRGLLAD